MEKKVSPSPASVEKGTPASVRNERMGKSASKTVSTEGDPQVNIINQLEDHSVRHESHELKLWLILSLNVLQIIWAVLLWNMKRIKLKAFLKGTKSNATLDMV